MASSLAQLDGFEAKDCSCAADAHHGIDDEAHNAS
jgi:hypothetical protein